MARRRLDKVAPRVSAGGKLLRIGGRRNYSRASSQSERITKLLRLFECLLTRKSIQEAFACTKQFQKWQLELINHCARDNVSGVVSVCRVIRGAE